MACDFVWETEPDNAPPLLNIVEPLASTVPVNPFHGETVDVMTPATRRLSFANATGAPVDVRVDVPPSALFRLDVRPRHFALPPGAARDVAFTLQLYCNVPGSIAVAVSLNGTAVALPLSCRARPSPWINPEHVAGLDSSAVIGRGAFGVVVEGEYNAQRCAIKQVTLGAPQVTRELEMLLAIQSPPLSSSSARSTSASASTSSWSSRRRAASTRSSARSATSSR